MREVAFLLDLLTSTLLVETPEDIPIPLLDQLTLFLGAGQPLACAAPLQMLPPLMASPEEIASNICVRIAGYYHNSLVEGLGRRSTVKLQGCPIRCRGCITPDSWDPGGGTSVPVEWLVDALLDPIYERDGVSILGGEPFAQPDGLWTLVRVLWERGCPHILAYSGYTYECLRSMSASQPAIGAVLDTLDVLIDGPFVAALANSAGPWTGSGNQRVIDLAATRRTGQVVLLDDNLSD